MRWLGLSSRLLAIGRWESLLVFAPRCAEKCDDHSPAHDASDEGHRDAGIVLTSTVGFALVFRAPIP